MNRPVRIALALAGVAAIAWGGWLALTGGRATDLRSMATWAAAVLVAHDLVLAPVVVGLGWLVARVLPTSARAPVQVGALVAASVALMSAPLWLGRLVRGPSTANPSANPLDYPRNLVVVLAVIGAVTALAAAARWTKAAAQRRNATNSRPPSDHRSSTW